MRISDWSSDVCSSDLLARHRSAPLRRLGTRHSDRYRLALAEAIVGIPDDDPEPVDQIGAHILRLDRFRSEFGSGRNKADGALIGPWIAVGGDSHLHAGCDAAKVGLCDIGADPGRSEENTTELQSLMR